jgi:transposase
MHFVGIDWAKDKHDVCLLADDGHIVSEFTMANSQVGFHKLRDVVAPLDRFKVNIERSDGLLVDWMVGQDWNVYITPGRITARRRPRRSKDDRGDAYLLAYLLRLGDTDCRPIVHQSAIVEQLKQLTGAYDDALREQRRLSNQMLYTLQQYYPTALGLFKPTALINLAFLEHFPTPQAAQALNRRTLAAFLKGQDYRHMDRLDELIEQLHTPTILARVQDGHVETVRMLIPLLRSLFQRKPILEKHIVAVFRDHPEAAWWQSFPGASGPLTPARLLAWIGDDRQRFPTAQSLQATAGTVPVTRRSGKQHSVEFREACSHPLRRAVDDLARHSIAQSGWANAYYHEQIRHGHSQPRAFRALGNRWLKIIWTL